MTRPLNYSILSFVRKEPITIENLGKLLQNVSDTVLKPEKIFQCVDQLIQAQYVKLATFGEQSVFEITESGKKAFKDFGRLLGPRVKPPVLKTAVRDPDVRLGSRIPCLSDDFKAGPR